MIKLAPSVLAADFSRLGEEIKKVHENGAEYLHLDVMDGMFVPNISLGPGMISSIRKVSDIVFDVHLMIQDPIRYIDDFAKAGADIIVHGRSESDTLKNTAAEIETMGNKVYTVYADTAVPEQIYGMFDKIKKEFGRLDILVNNAAVLSRQPFLELFLPLHQSQRVLGCR